MGKEATPLILYEKLETTLHAYTFAALTEDEQLGKRSLQVMIGLDFVWTDFVALSEKETCSMEASQKLVRALTFSPSRRLQITDCFSAGEFLGLESLGCSRYL